MSQRLAQIRNAIDAFDIERARQLLRDELRENPSAEAYILAAEASTSDQQRRNFLKKAAELDPFHSGLSQSSSQDIFNNPSEFKQQFPQQSYPQQQSYPSQQNYPQQPYNQQPYNQQPSYGNQQFAPRLNQYGNTSGTGDSASVPPELNGWNWGAFFLSWIWGLGNNSYLALLCLIPYINFIMIFVVGAKGNEWAWRNKEWQSVQQFKETQRKWAIAGLVLFCIGLLFSCFVFLVILESGF